jgi:CHAT domain-containing protein/Tfp pilus assembly protein PilF
VFRRIVSIPKILTLIFFLISVYFPAQIAKSQTNTETITLELNKPIEREISGSRKDAYQISLSANQYIKVIIEQRGVDIAVRLSGTDGKNPGDFDGEMRPDKPETIEYVAPADGAYRLDVSAKYPLLPTGKYEIRLAEIHTATETEKSLQEARSAYADSLRQFSGGKYDEAKSSIDRAVAIRQKELGAENALTAVALTHLARILDAQGKFDEAEQLNQQILASRQKILGAEHPDVAYTLNYLALNNNHKENFQKALEYHQRSLALREKIFGANHPIVAVSLINLGVVYDSLGDKLKAGELYERASKIQEQSVGAENLNFAIILNNIGKIYNDLEDYKKAEPFLVRANAILEKLFPPDNPRIYDSLINLADSYFGQGELEKAETLTKRILEFREKSVGENHPLTALTLYNLANIYAEKNDFVKAEPLYRRALAIREDFFTADSPGVSEVLSGLALLLAKKGDVDESLKLQQRANEIDERNINLNLSIGSERQKLAFINALSERINQSLFIQARFAPENPLAAELAVTSVLRQKGRVLDAVSNNLIELRRRFNPQDRALLDELNGVMKQIAELVLNGREEDQSNEDFQAKIKVLSDKREKLEDEVSRRAAGFYEKSEPVTVSSVRALIPADSALIEFATYTPSSSKPDKAGAEPHYAVYILRNLGEIKWKDLGEAKEINQRIDAFRQALRDPKRKDIQQLARAVDEKVMLPVRALSGDAKHLLVSPDGALNLIPFEALSDEKGNYLVENYAFTYLTSGRDLLRMQVKRESKNKPLIIANPVFGDLTVVTNQKPVSKTTGGKRRSISAERDLSGVFFTPLVGTKQEARAIQTIFPEAVLLDGTQATESALKQTVAPQILHIATHGFFLEDTETAALPDAMRGLKSDVRFENPLLQSGLALAGANNRKGIDNDGILTALEASGLNLWGTKLVVLSACDTGLGEIRNGEGVYGLRRAFVLAGAESLLMSLWSVSDLVTRELMTGYYKNLKQGMGRSAALRQVQLEMLKRPERQHPFYWASFIQSGNWANLDGKR